MKKYFSKFIKKIIISLVSRGFGEHSAIFRIIQNNERDNLFLNANVFNNSTLGYNSKLYPPHKLINTHIGDYSYISQNSILNNTKIGKFCSIGPNLISGWGIHPTNGVSTHPMFYSTIKQNGTTLSNEDKTEETKSITIGNDVFIGMNVTILDGVKIGDGAVIGAGAVVSKDILPYAIAVGSPIEIKSYRFNKETIEHLLNINWWDFSEEMLKNVEDDIFNVDSFILKNKI